jgi:Gas vesicle synthesis protein GvpO/SAP domain
MHDELEWETEFDSMTKAELKAEARTRGLSTTGTKAALLERVEAHAGHGESGGNGGGQQAVPAANDRTGPSESRGDGLGDATQPAEAESEPEEAEEAESEPEEAEEGEAEPEAAEDAEREPEEAEEGEAEPEAAEDAEHEPEAAAEAGGGPELSEAPEQAPTAGAGGDGAGVGLTKVASAAAQALAELTGRTVDAVSGVRKTDDGYQVTIEVLELSRVPSTTDVLATYEVGVAPDGSVVDYSRAHRYYRNQTSRE